MDNDYITENFLPSDDHVESVDESISAVSDQSIEPKVETADIASMSLSELNQALGKNFNTKEAAIKSIKDTFSYVGKKIEKIENFDSSHYISREQYETDMFYNSNKDYEPFRKVIDNLAKATGVRPSDIVSQPEYSSMFEKVRNFDESEKTQNVLKSNPRISNSVTKLSKAREAISQNNRESGEALATQAVMEAYGMQ